MIIFAQQTGAGKIPPCAHQLPDLPDVPDVVERPLVQHLRQRDLPRGAVQRLCRILDAWQEPWHHIRTRGMLCEAIRPNSSRLVVNSKAIIESAMKFHSLQSDDRGFRCLSDAGNGDGISWSEIKSIKCRKGGLRNDPVFLEFFSKSGKCVEFDMDTPGFQHVARGLSEHIPHIPGDWSEALRFLPAGSHILLWDRDAPVPRSRITVKDAASSATRNSGPGYPRATLAYYGPTNSVATKVVVRIIPFEGADHAAEGTWFSRGDYADVRHEQSTFEPIQDFMKSHNVKKVEILRRTAEGLKPDEDLPEEAMGDVVGCPHDEGIDFPAGDYCRRCRYWVRRHHHPLWRRLHRWIHGDRL